MAAAEFVPLSAAISLHIDKIISVIGVVVDVRPPIKSRRDYMVTFVLCDRTKSQIENGLMVRFFNASIERLPPVQGLDDIVILRNIKMGLYNEKPIAISHHDTSWIVGSLSPVRKDFLIKTSSSAVKVTSQEMNMINALRDFWKKRGGAASSRGLNPQSLPEVTEQDSRKRKFAYIKDMEYDHFYDLTGEVVKAFSGANCFTVYLTDYTRNTNLYCYELPNSGERPRTSYEDEDFYTGRSGNRNSKWTGPYGQYTLQITLWDVHAEAARKIIRDGCLLNLKNVRAKMNADGKLEGSLHGDRRYPDRVDISLVENHEDPTAILLSRRKTEYHRRTTVQLAEHEEKFKKQTEEMEQREREEREYEEREREEQREAAELNQNIVTLKANGIPNTLIGDILQPVDIDLRETPYVNRKYKTICRVIDFLPNKLEQFCIPKENVPKKLYNLLEKDGQIMSAYSDGSRRPAHDDDGQDDEDDDVSESQKNEWEFKFALLVEGKDGTTMRLLVDDKSAQFLLNMDPTDLKSNPRAFAELREKLFVLWGDSEERKSRKLERLLDKNDRKKENRRKRKSTTTSSTTKHQSKKPRKIARKTCGGGNNNSDDDSGGGGGNTSDGGSDEDENGLIVGGGKYFTALVREYGVRKVNSEGEEYWQRTFGLFGVMIKHFK